MKNSEFEGAISHLRLEFTGCEYEEALDYAIKEELIEYGIRPVVRGTKAPAAGVGLSVDIVLTVASGVASCLIVEALKAIFEHLSVASNKALSCKCFPKRTTVESDGCDFVITANCNAGYYPDRVDFNNLLKEMEQLRIEELAMNRNVIKIETPCCIDSSADPFVVETRGVGNYSLWLVHYSGGERWPFCLYDAINDAFFPVGDGLRIVSGVCDKDRFYSEEQSLIEPY